MALTYGSNTPKTRRRLGELILYIAERCADDHTLGATKLNKILWFSDFLGVRTPGYTDYRCPLSETGAWSGTKAPTHRPRVS